MRPSARSLDEMRSIVIQPHITKHAEGSCLIKCGETQVICTASVETKLPPWLRNSGQGWVTAEYGMLPRATGSRNRREAASGKQSGRTQEIQRLIGRSLRAGVDLLALGEHQITIDCDVIQADGGTRCASITGGWVALAMAIKGLLAKDALRENPLRGQIAAVSCGIYAGQPILDLDYAEDSEAGTDANFILNDQGGIVELQGTAENAAFSRDEFNQMMDLAQKGAAELILAQRDAVDNA